MWLSAEYSVIQYSVIVEFFQILGKCLILYQSKIVSICEKIFEKNIFNYIFLLLKNNNLLTPKQSSFRINDSWVNELLSIFHSIYSDFDRNPTLEIRGIFLDISNAFDKVWQEGLLYKLEALGVLGNLLKLFQSFLSNRKQRVVLNDQHS